MSLSAMVHNVVSICPAMINEGNIDSLKWFPLYTMWVDVSRLSLLLSSWPRINKCKVCWKCSLLHTSGKHGRMSGGGGCGLSRKLNIWFLHRGFAAREMLSPNCCLIYIIMAKGNFWACICHFPFTHFFQKWAEVINWSGIPYTIVEIC